jgi:hypothetical protein
MKSRILIAIGCMVALLLLMAAPAFGGGSSGDLVNKTWKVYNAKAGTTSSWVWDVNKASKATGGGVKFTVQPFVSSTNGSFVAYLLLDYNVDLTGKTISAKANWGGAPYQTRWTSLGYPGAYVRLEFQDTTGAYNSNDYWWSTDTLDLNALTGGTLTVSTADRSHWFNQSWKLASDTTQDWLEWQGDVVHMSPYDGFTKALMQVKKIGLSFGSLTGSAASGIAVDGASTTFTLGSFVVTRP